MELLRLSVSAFLGAMITFAPILATAIVGMVLCRQKLARSHPEAYGRATLGWVFLILYVVVGVGVRLVVANYATQSGNRQGFTGWIAAANLASVALLLASLILLLQAILANRGGSEPSP